MVPDKHSRSAQGDGSAVGSGGGHLAAGFPPMRTVEDPIMITSGGPVQVTMSVARAAGMPAIKTVGQPGGITGPPTCGTNPVTIGQTCISPILAAGNILPKAEH